ncbi:MAG: DUF4387 domain-containing protein [Clostridia bacterium]
MAEYRLYDLASVIRSKNSGPFQITLDVLFDNADTYACVKQSGAITAECIASQYHIASSRIQNIVYFDTALGLKITYDREIPSGTCGDRDVYGAQQHMPLAELRITLEGL